MRDACSLLQKMSKLKFGEPFKSSLPSVEETTKRVDKSEIGKSGQKENGVLQSKCGLTPEPNDFCENARSTFSKPPFKRWPMSPKYIRHNVKEVNKMEPRTLFPNKAEPKLSFKSLMVGLN